MGQNGPKIIFLLLPWRVLFVAVGQSRKKLDEIDTRDRQRTKRHLTSSALGYLTEAGYRRKAECPDVTHIAANEFTRSYFRLLNSIETQQYPASGLSRVMENVLHTETAYRLKKKRMWPVVWVMYSMSRRYRLPKRLVSNFYCQQIITQQQTIRK